MYKARFAKAHELQELLGQPAPNEASLLLGIGPYGRLVRLKPTAAQRELGNLMVVAPTRKGKGLLAVSQLLTHALLHWEDLGPSNATRILER